MTQTLDPSLGEQAREALMRHAWSDAYALLSDADRQGDLDPDELELLAQASWWTGRLPAAIEARERAFAGYSGRGDDAAAARTATFLGRDNLLGNKRPVAVAWLKRAERLLGGVAEGRGHGWLAVTRSLEAGLDGRVEEAAAHADRAAGIAERFGDRDLAALAMSSKAICEIHMGRVEEGLGLADEATLLAVAGGIDPLTAGAISCSTISACTTLGDWPRAIQWTEAQDRWCQREQINGFPGICRLHRAETKRLRGAWLEAETEARRAAEELEGYVPAAIGVAHYEVGVLRLRRGDLVGAEEALLRAHAFGRDPQPELALLRLAQGRTSEAAASIRRALEEPEHTTSWGMPPGTEIDRISLLPAQVEIALASDDVATARTAADELVRLRDRFTTATSRAVTAWVEGLVLTAESKAGEAVRRLRESIALWTELDAPWEAARARLGLARAYEALGDPDAATLEARAAGAAFEDLGAELDRRHTDDLLRRLGQGAQAGPALGGSTLKTFVFTDIVDSTRLAELLGTDGWAELIRWHDETLRSLVAEHGGQIVKSTGDGFFLAFEGPGPAIDCAVAIQRRLAQQRQAQGFAPALRIGIHRGPARRRGLDYFGLGVNEAARIGAIAEGGEILASAETIAAARRSSAAAARRTVTLKGISAPVEVAAIAW
jgi:class 3 adenylate cyclase